MMEGLWESLVVELQHHVWSFVPMKDLFRQQEVCAHWRNILREDATWEAYYRM